MIPSNENPQASGMRLLYNLKKRLRGSFTFLTYRLGVLCSVTFPVNQKLVYVTGPMIPTTLIRLIYHVCRLFILTSVSFKHHTNHAQNAFMKSCHNNEDKYVMVPAGAMHQKTDYLQ